MEVYDRLLRNSNGSSFLDVVGLAEFRGQSFVDAEFGAGILLGFRMEAIKDGKKGLRLILGQDDFRSLLTRDSISTMDIKGSSKFIACADCVEIIWLEDGRLNNRVIKNRDSH